MAYVLDEFDHALRRAVIKHNGYLIEVEKELGLRPGAASNKLYTQKHANWWTSFKKKVSKEKAKIRNRKKMAKRREKLKNWQNSAGYDPFLGEVVLEPTCRTIIRRKN